MKTYEFIYIATDFYIYYFDGFVKSLENFAKDKLYKKVILLTDDQEFDISQYNNLTNITVTKRYIQNFPWPIITLFKLHYMYDFVINDDYDKIFYVNSNATFYPMENIPEDFEKHDLLLSYMNKTGRFSHWQDKNPYNKTLKYVIGGFFGGNKETMKELCKSIMLRINYLLYNNKIEWRHEETALNWYVSLLDQNINYKIITWQDYLDLNNNIVTDKNGQPLQHVNGCREFKNEIKKWCISFDL